MATRNWRAALAGAAAAACMAASNGAAQVQPAAQAEFDTSAGNLLAVLRESRGENKQDEALQPFGKVLVRTDDGRDLELDTSWFQFLGDMHVRLVFDGRQTLQSASPEDLTRLHLSPEEALALGTSNLKRRYGTPVVEPWSNGVMQVEASATDLTSSYFLDRGFWEALEAANPGGVVVAVPRRGGLVYAPLSNEEAVQSLRFGAPAMYSGAAGARLSSALYLFKGGRWSVFQPPLAAR